jgi:hypothetical protein
MTFTKSQVIFLVVRILTPPQYFAAIIEQARLNFS